MKSKESEGALEKNQWSRRSLECVSLGQRIGKMKVETSVFDGALHGK